MSELLTGLIGLLGIIIGAAITWLRECWNEHRLRKRRAAYLSVRIICILDRYVSKCHDAIEEQSTKVLTPEFPDDVDWKSIDSKLMYRILDFPNQSLYIQQYVDYMSCHDGTPDNADGVRAYAKHVSKLCLEALEVKDLLMEAYNLPSEKLTKFTFTWGLKEYFEKKIEENCRGHASDVSMANN
jgi:hypothetical protein